MGFSNKDMITLQNILRSKNQTITTAESCTGGLIVSMITQQSGSSDILKGAIITYSNESKTQELNVKVENLINFGAVSVEVVSDMLDGALIKFNADYAIAISGIAGPTGGTKTKPVGTVVIGIASKSGYKNIHIYSLKGNRKQIQKKTAQKALKELLKLVKKA